MTRFVAALLATWFVAVASAGAVVFCAGWSASPAERHDCCKAMVGRPSSPDEARDCCAVSEQSSSRAPIEARVAAPALAIAVVSPLAVTPIVSAIPSFAAGRSIHPSQSSPPLFLVQRALLI